MSNDGSLRSTCRTRCAALFQCLGAFLLVLPPLAAPRLLVFVSFFVSFHSSGLHLDHLLERPRSNAR